MSNKKLAFAAIAAEFSSMSYTGTIENGVVRLPANVALPDGTQVRVEVVEKSRRPFASADLVGSVDGDGIPATNERVRKVMRCER